MKKTILMLFLITLFCFIISCNNNENAEISNYTKNDKKEFIAARNAIAQDTLSLKIEDNSYKVLLTGVYFNKQVKSNLKVYLSNDLIFDIPYDFDMNEEHWKLKQASKVISQASILKHISPQVIIDVQKILDKSIDYTYAEILDSKNRDLASIINFHNAILNTTIRSNNEKSDCNCNVHPGFIVDKTFFNCQEDQYYEVDKLKLVLNNYIKNNEADDSTSRLIDYLKNTSEKNIRFDDYYNFYFPKESFQNSINDFLERKAPERCWLGQGSGHGCCGNYSGCCYYINPICHVHDAMCSDCKPSWFCLPGCKPDKHAVNVDSIEIF